MTQTFLLFYIHILLMHLALSLNGSSGSSFIKRNSQMEQDPLLNVAKDFKDFSNDLRRLLALKSQQKDQFHQQQQNMIRKSKYKNYLQISSKEPSKIELLNEFLAIKIYQYAELVNLMIIPEFRISLDGSVKVVKSKPVTTNRSISSTASKTTSYKIGTTSCNLERISYMRVNTPVPVCPWHWVIMDREDKFPFKRANAQCNCENCQAKTIYDSDIYRLSSCQQEFVLLPVLVREVLPTLFKTNDTIEKWWFNMEEVPTSCICSLKINPQI